MKPFPIHYIINGTFSVSR